jgi:hypothetical protein
MISVRLDCRPSILNTVLTPLLRDLPDVALVYPTSTGPDVVVVSAFAGTDTRLDWLKAASPGRTIIALDSQNNTLRVRRGDQKATDEWALAGTLANLRDVLRELAQVDVREMASA